VIRLRSGRLGFHLRQE